MSKKQADRLIAQHNVRVTIDTGYNTEYTLDAPPGMVFAGTFCHWVTYTAFTGMKAEMWDQIVEDLEDGLTECDETDCSMCLSETDVRSEGVSA